MNPIVNFAEESIEFYAPAVLPAPLKIPLFSSRVPAGFPSPAEDYVEDELDLNRHLVPHPSATFFVRTHGDSMRPAGIQSGDLLIIDKSLKPQHNDIVLAFVSGDWTVKRLYCAHGETKLVADNQDYPPITITGELDMVIWGVVRHVVHTPKRLCTR